MAERRAHRPDPKAQALHARKIVRKLLAFDAETWHALRLLAGDSKTSFEALCAAAFADLLKKHGRSVTLDGARKGSPHRQGGKAARAHPSPDGRAAMPALPAIRARRKARAWESG